MTSMAGAEEGESAGLSMEVDWDEVDKIDAALGTVSSNVARLEIETVIGRIVTEKKKLSALVTKHAQACEELLRVRKEVEVRLLDVSQVGLMTVFLCDKQVAWLADN